MNEMNSRLMNEMNSRLMNERMTVKIDGLTV